jgi:hypothetical protein
LFSLFRAGLIRPAAQFWQFVTDRVLWLIGVPVLTVVVVQFIPAVGDVSMFVGWVGLPEE